MKNKFNYLAAAALLSFTLMSCKSHLVSQRGNLVAVVKSDDGTAMRQTFGITEEKLIETVSVETGCAIKDIKITNKVQSLGHATYSLDVCGKRMVYKQIGSVFMRDKEADKLMKEVQKGKS